MAATTPTLRDTLSHPVWYPYSIDEASPSFKASLLRDWMGTPAKAVMTGVLGRKGSTEENLKKLKEFLPKPELQDLGYGRNSLFTAIIGGASTSIVKQIGKYVDPFTPTDEITFPGSGERKKKTLLPIHAAWHVNNLSLFKHLLAKMAEKRNITKDEMLNQVLSPPVGETWLPLKIFAGVQPTSKFKNYFKDTEDRLIREGVTRRPRGSASRGLRGAPADAPLAGSSSGTSAPTGQDKTAHQRALLELTQKFLSAAEEKEKKLQAKLKKKNSELRNERLTKQQREKIVAEARALVEKEKKRKQKEYKDELERERRLEEQLKSMKRQRATKDDEYQKEMAVLAAKEADFAPSPAASSTTTQAQIASSVRFQHFRE